MGRRKSLARKIIVLTVLFSSCITLLLTSNQLFQDYRSDVRTIHRALDQMENVYLETFRAKLWIFDKEQLLILMNGILRTPDLLYVEIKKDGKTLFFVGARKDESTISHEFAVDYDYDETKVHLGTINIVASMEGVYHRLWVSAWTILAGNAIKTFAVSLFMLFIFQILVTRRLGQVTAATRRFAEGDHSARTGFSGTDELGSMGRAFDDMADRIAREFEERERTEAALRESKERLQTILDSSPIGAGISRIHDGSVQFANSKLCQLLQMKPEEIIGSSARDHWANPEERDAFLDILNREGSIKKKKAEVKRRDGTTFQCLLSWEKISILDEKIILYWVDDITEQERAEEALRESENRYARAMAGTQDGLWDWNIVTGETYYSPRWLEILGYGEGDLETTLEVFMSLVHLEDQETQSKAMVAHLEDRQPYHVEFRVRKKDGGYLWIRSRGQAEWDEQGNPLRMAGSISDISLRKKAEDEAHINRMQLEEAVEAISEGFLLFDAEERLILANSAFRSLYSEISDQLVPGISFENWAQICAHTGQVLDAVGREEAWVAQRLEDFRNPKGQKEYLIKGNRWLRVSEYKTQSGYFAGLRMDITEQKEAEEALGESQRLLRSVVDTIPQWIFVKDLENRYLMVNRAFADTYGKHPDELINATPTDLSIGTEKERKIFRQADLKVLETEAAVDIPHVEVTYPDGETHIQHIVKMPFRNDEGKIRGVLGVLEDITERNRIEAQLRLQAQIIEQTHECIITTDETGLITSWNGGAERLFGYTAKEAIGKMKGADLYPAHMETYFQEQLYQPAFEKGSRTHEMILKKKSGVEIPGLVSLTLLKNEQGEVLGRIGHTLDITELKEAENARRESERQIRLIADSVPAMIAYLDAEKRYRYINRQYQEWLGSETEQVIGKSMEEVLGGEAFRKIEPNINKALSGEQVTFEAEIPHAVSGMFHARANYVPHVDQAGGTLGFYALIYDITEQKQAEEALRRWNETLEQRVTERTAALESAQEELVRKEKMATLGQLTATVSHELRNPLGTIRTSVFSILEKTSPDVLGIGKSLARIDRSITRCDNIISDLLDYTRNRAPKPSPTDVDRWIAELMKEQNVPDWLELEFKLAVDNRPVELEQEYIRRAVINLYDNARQALEGGKDGSNGKKPKITIGARIEKKWLKISVKDTGPGMSQEVLDKIFEPLFSTKTYGIGLGLATVRQIVEMNGGTISIKSRLGKGTQALLKLPLNPSPPKKPGAK